MKRFAPPNRRETYELLLLPLPVGLGFASFVPTWFIARGLARALGLAWAGVPMRSQPNGWLWFVLFLVTMNGLMAAGGWLGCMLTARVLRRLERRGLIPAADGGEALRDDPLFDPDFDATEGHPNFEP